MIPRFNPRTFADEFAVSLDNFNTSLDTRPCKHQVCFEIDSAQKQGYYALIGLQHLWLMLGRGAKLASGVEVPVFLPMPVSLAVKDLPAFTGSVTASLEVRLVSASVRTLLTSAPPLLLTTSLTAVYTCS